MNRRLIGFFVAVALAALLIGNADAADYAAGFSIGAGASHNDNIRLSQTDQLAVSGIYVTPVLTFDINTETTRIQLDSTFAFNRYDKSEYNSDDQNISLALSSQFETNTLGLSATYIRNSTITSELLTTGRTGDHAVPAEQYVLSANWGHTFNEANLIQLSGTYTTQKYESDAYVGFKNTGGEFDWIHLISDRTKFVVAALASDYQSDDIKLMVPAITVPYFIPPFTFKIYIPGSLGEQSYAAQTRSAGAHVGVDYQWSEQSLIKARFGRSKARTSYAVEDPEQICAGTEYLKLVAYVGGPIGGACDLQETSGLNSNSELDWTWSNEKQQFSLNASKTFQPTSNGYAVDSTLIGSNWSYQLSERNRITAGLSAARNRAIDKENLVKYASQADRDYGSATLQYQRQLGEFWLVNASFQYSEEKYIQFDYHASSRVYSLGLSYRPQQWHWAR